MCLWSRHVSTVCCEQDLFKDKAHVNTAAHALSLASSAALRGLCNVELPVCVFSHLTYSRSLPSAWQNGVES